MGSQSHGGVIPGSSAGVQVRCAGCRVILTVTSGLTEFVCPFCQLAQMLPPELMGKVLPKPPLSSPPPLHHVPAHGIDPTKIQLPCANCKAILNVPPGLARFACPQCGVDLAVDLSKLKQFFSSRFPLPPSPEDVNEVYFVFVFVFPFAFVCEFAFSGFSILFPYCLWKWVESILKFWTVVVVFW